MRKELIITILVFLIIIISDIFLQNYIKGSVEEIKNDLENLKKEVLDSGIESKELEEKVKTIYEKWEIKNKVLTFFVEHDELEKVNTELNKIKGYFEVDMKDDSMTDINETIYVLEHIREKQKVSLKNVF